MVCYMEASRFTACLYQTLKAPTSYNEPDATPSEPCGGEIEWCDFAGRRETSTNKFLSLGWQRTASKTTLPYESANWGRYTERDGWTRKVE